MGNGKFKDEDARREAAGLVLEDCWEEDQRYVIGRLMDECEYSFDEANLLLADQKAGMEDYHEDR